MIDAPLLPSLRWHRNPGYLCLRRKNWKHSWPKAQQRTQFFCGTSLSSVFQAQHQLSCHTSVWPDAPGLYSIQIPPFPGIHYFAVFQIPSARRAQAAAFRNFSAVQAQCAFRKQNLSECNPYNAQNFSHVVSSPPRRIPPPLQTALPPFPPIS